MGIGLQGLEHPNSDSLRCQMGSIDTWKHLGVVWLAEDERSL